MTSVNIEWLGELPRHWGLERLKYGYRLIKRPPGPQDETVTAFRDGQVTLRTNRRTEGFTEADKEIGYQGIRKGDLVIHAMDAFAGAIGVSDSDGKSSPVYLVCSPIGESEPKYTALVLRHIALSGYIASLGKGVRERSTDFRWSDAKDVLVPVPPVAEQMSIVRFVERETSKIDKLIERLERMVRVLRERRQALVSAAVTGKIDVTGL